MISYTGLDDERELYIKGVNNEERKYLPTQVAQRERDVYVCARYIDSVSRLFFQFLVIQNNENLPIAKKIAKVGSELCQIAKKSSKDSQRLFLILPMCPIFTNLAHCLPIMKREQRIERKRPEDQTNKILGRKNRGRGGVAVAQLVERSLLTPVIRGLNPVLGKFY